MSKPARWLLPIALSALVLGSLGAALPAFGRTAPVAADTSSMVGQLCDDYGAGPCLMPSSSRLGTSGQAYRVAVVNQPEAALWLESPTGRTVTDASHHAWPFTAGTGLNGRYVGDPVVRIVSGGDGSRCLANDGGSVVVRDCDRFDRPPQLWVIDARRLINVSATDQEVDRGAPAVVLSDDHGWAYDQAYGTLGSGRQHWALGELLTGSPARG